MKRYRLPICVVISLSFALMVVMLSSCQKSNLQAELFSHDPSVRMLALGKLAELKKAQKSKLVPNLMKALNDEDTKIANYAEDALKILGPAAMPNLIQAMNDPDPYIRLSATEVIGHIGLSVSGVVHALAQALTDPFPLVREQAGLSLGRSPETIGLLILALQDNNQNIRSSAARVLKLLDTPEARNALKKSGLRS